MAFEKGAEHCLFRDSLSSDGRFDRKDVVLCWIGQCGQKVQKKLIRRYLNLMSRLQNNLILLIFAILCSFPLVISGSVDASGETENVSDQAEVVWPEFRNGNYDIYYSRLTDSGWTEKIPLSDSAETNDMMPSIGLGGDDVRWVVWTADSGQKSELFYCHSNEGEWTDPKKISTGLLFNTAPSILIDQKNMPWIVWAGSNGKRSDIFYSRWDGHGWEQPLRVNKADSTPDIMPLIGVDREGIPWVCWFGFDDYRYRPYSCKWSSGGWGDEIESENDNLYEILIAMSDAGGVPTLPPFVTDPDKACVYVRNRGQLQSLAIRYFSIENLLTINAPSVSEPIIESLLSPSGELIILGFGDSITQGYPYITIPGDGRRVGGYEPELESNLIVDSRPSRVLNWGVGGEWTVAGLVRINDVLTADPNADYILILEGTNDIQHNLYDFETTVFNLGQMIEKSWERGVIPILSTLIPDTTVLGLAKQINTTYNPAIKDLAAEKGVILADQYAGLIDNWDSYNYDYRHPNYEGYLAMAHIWFSVIPKPPTATTMAAGPIGFTSAVLNGTVNPDGVSTQYYFEYGQTTSYGTTTTVNFAGSGIGAAAVSEPVINLAIETSYHFRIVAFSSAGISYGDDLTFATHIPSCDGCGGDVVILQDVVFSEGTECECAAGTSISIENVTIESGADVRFVAPEVNIGNQFNAELGSSVSIRQN
jgi:lysophospholipase L1-like esterase